MDGFTRVMRTAVILPVTVAIWSCGDGDETDNEACASCDDYMASVEDYEETIEQLVVDYPEEFGDLSWKETCATRMVESDEAVYFCNTMVNMCDQQYQYNECVDRSCGGKGKLELDCIPARD